MAPSMKIPSPPPRHVRDEMPEGQGFRFQSGENARSLEQFGAAVAHAPASVVWYHREHFVPWVRDVLLDAPLARRIQQYAESASDPETFREILRDLVAKRLADLAA